MVYKLCFCIQQNKSTLMINYLEYEVNRPSQTHPELHLEPLQEYSQTLHELQPYPYDNHPHPHTSTSNSIHMLDYSFVDEVGPSPQHQLLFEQESQRQKVVQDSQQKEAKRQLRRLKNQTKNIPKNFGKGIISFMQRNQAKVRALLEQHNLPYSSFRALMKGEKKVINTIADLRRLWTDRTYGKCMRIISNLFFRRHSMEYIFNSRITNYSSHIKYRASLWEAIKCPEEFNHIKQY